MLTGGGETVGVGVTTALGVGVAALGVRVAGLVGAEALTGDATTPSGDGAWDTSFFCGRFCGLEAASLVAEEEVLLEDVIGKMFESGGREP